MDASDKIFSIFNAFGLLFFTYAAFANPGCCTCSHPGPPRRWSVAFVLVEIVDTIAHEPIRRARKAFNYSYAAVAVILFSVAVVTYGSVGDMAPSWFLDSFTTPQWLIIVANLAIVLSLIPGYNLYLLPFVVMVEQPLERRFPRLHPRVLKLIWRSIVVIMLAIVGALLPFFTNVISLVGAIGFVRRAGVVYCPAPTAPPHSGPSQSTFRSRCGLSCTNPSCGSESRCTR